MKHFSVNCNQVQSDYIKSYLIQKFKIETSVIKISQKNTHTFYLEQALTAEQSLTLCTHLYVYLGGTSCT